MVPRQVPIRAAGSANRTLRDRDRRHFVSRRDRLALRRHPGEAASGLQSGEFQRLGKQSNTSSGCEDCQRQQCGHRGSGDRRPAAGGFVVSTQCGRARDSTAGSSSRGHPATGGALSPVYTPKKNRMSMNVDWMMGCAEHSEARLARQRSRIAESNPESDGGESGGLWQPIWASREQRDQAVRHRRARSS